MKWIAVFKNKNTFKFVVLILNKINMKKIILTVAAVFALSFANAQDLKSKKGENYLPQSGDWAIGFNADGLFHYVGNTFNQAGNNAAPSVGFQNAGTFVGKRFTSDKTAQRVIANFAFGSNSSEDAAGTKVASSGLNLSLGLGKEWRRGSTRLQGFYGADVMLNVNSNSTKTTAVGYEKDVKSGLGFGIGAQGFLGAEYFLFPKISIGAQYTYGLMIGVQGASTTTETGMADVKGSKSSGFNLGGVGVSSINMTLHF